MVISLWSEMGDESSSSSEDWGGFMGIKGSEACLLRWWWSLSGVSSNIWPSLLSPYFSEQKPLTVLASSRYWDLYVLVKYLVEVIILFLMLYFLQGRKGHNNNNHHHHRQKDFKPNRREYQEVKDVENGVSVHLKYSG